MTKQVASPWVPWSASNRKRVLPARRNVRVFLVHRPLYHGPSLRNPSQRAP